MSNFNELIPATSGNILTEWTTVGIEEAIASIPFDQSNELYETVTQSIYENAISGKATTKELVRSMIANIYSDLQSIITGSIKVTIPNAVTGVTYDGFSVTVQTGVVTGYLGFN